MPERRSGIVPRTHSERRIGPERRIATRAELAYQAMMAVEPNPVGDEKRRPGDELGSYHERRSGIDRRL